MRNHRLAIALALLLATTAAGTAQSAGQGSSGAVMGVPSKGSLKEPGSDSPDIGGASNSDVNGSPEQPMANVCPKPTPAPGMTTAEQRHENRQCRSPRDAAR